MGWTLWPTKIYNECGYFDNLLGDGLIFFFLKIYCWDPLVMANACQHSTEAGGWRTD